MVHLYRKTYNIHVMVSEGRTIILIFCLLLKIDRLHYQEKFCQELGLQIIFKMVIDISLGRGKGKILKFCLLLLYAQKVRICLTFVLFVYLIFILLYFFFFCFWKDE